MKQYAHGDLPKAFPMISSPLPHIVVIGGGFAGLWATRALAAFAGSHHPGRPLQPPPVPAAALPGGDRGLVVARYRRAAAPHPAQAAQCGSAAGAKSATSMLPRNGSRLDDGSRAGFRLSAAGQRRYSRLLRARRMGQACAGPEDAGRCAAAAPAPAARVRARRGRAGPGQARGLAEFRHRRRRPDRRGTGGHAGGDRAPYADQRVPQHRSVGCARAADRSRAAGAVLVSGRPVGESAQAAGEAGRRSFHRHRGNGHRRIRLSAGR